ncbi:YktB family protein [Aneurinibacillus aneurinilyticus]|jgi:uncharacterized protein YktB (UPF0637 family)|uniref:UPF0637 protein HMPREF0083_04957 n=1 Tax=Aneurinibacillus aneurinilyticus ATCC 12856 TaxID=649747 RepID=U1WXF1_ANEAE|nr:DUF1054 domain-containing protein [Aneurinibacillus aneurinilyticus]ERI06933.1 hypothetical protein HMPREF0083_04957 [Aneurinibacillus aneurinilyticus ATCC 12856]MCI1692232.1 DUF1054 domain-containing protein [Aneurinibacillus aneurinilyticus]MED0669156.1 DUF1054 domain-containing protein [Aneurinibacillus aneurinilyticus]MED0707872.1 DUF1054 domain-containing protein [Aneurinibacillus aneurinilyticus]MED0722285.1 DUF1054 domain-containing protein [Aneurinibacillus aneurinilyticus]
MNRLTEQDFAIFSVPGLEARMDALKETLRPKLDMLGQELTPFLSAETGDEMFYHVAKHARRTVHPPKDTWVAWACNKRGYKMLPHFQVGLWETHLFIWFAIIYESPVKPVFAERLEQEWGALKEAIPEHFVWSFDHTKPDTFPHSEMDDEKVNELIHKLKHVKKSEVLCGVTLSREQVAAMSAEELLKTVEATFYTLLPLYRLSYVYTARA